MEEVMCVDNKNWIWIAIAAALLLSGSFGGDDKCGAGVGGCGNFLDNIMGGNNSWMIILGLLFLFNQNC